MQNDLISRKALRLSLKRQPSKLIDGKQYIRLDAVLEKVRIAPSSDAVQVVHGRWKKHHFSHRTDTFGNPDIGVECSACGFRWYSVHDASDNFRYCPNCGAKMDAKG